MTKRKTKPRRRCVRIEVYWEGDLVIEWKRICDGVWRWMNKSVELSTTMRHAIQEARTVFPGCTIRKVYEEAK